MSRSEWMSCGATLLRAATRRGLQAPSVRMLSKRDFTLPGSEALRAYLQRLRDALHTKRAAPLTSAQLRRRFGSPGPSLPFSDSAGAVNEILSTSKAPHDV